MSARSLEAELADCDRVLKNCAFFKSRLPVLFPALEALPSLRYCYYYPSSSKIILGVRTREDLAVVRALQKGIWAKDPWDDDGEQCLRYTATIDGVEIDCRVSELPPSCHIEEERVDVPAHTRIVQRVVCNEPAKEHAEKGQVISTREEAIV